MLNPSWLNTFVTLVDTGHFTKTAEKLFMTQPGVSQHIRKLEDSCGYYLIRRENKRFEITEQGRMVYKYAGQLVKNEQVLLEQLAFDDPYIGTCSLACSGSLALLIYPKLLDLQSKYLELVVKLKAAPNLQILNEIQSGVIDQGIVTDAPNQSLFDVQEFGREELCLVFPKSVDTKANKDRLLKEVGLIDHPDASHYLSLYFAQSQEKDFMTLNIEDIPVVGYINQISQILKPVAQGLGFTILPKSAIDSFQESKALKIFKPRKTVIENLYRVKKRNRELPARYKTLNDTIDKIWLNI